MQEKNVIMVKVFDRIKEFYKLKNDVALSKFLGVSHSAISQSKTRNSTDWNVIHKKCSDMDMNWLLYGIEPVKPISLQPKIEILEKEIIELNEELKKNDADIEFIQNETTRINNDTEITISEIEKLRLENTYLWGLIKVIKP